MKSTTYGFSKFVSWSGMLLFATLFIFFLYLGIAFLHGFMQWGYLCMPLGITAVCLFAFVRWNFIPMLQGCVTLELDEEKAQCYLAGKVIYWKDVKEISTDYGRYYSGIKFEMIDDRKNQTISTKWIDGSAKSICETMQDYLV